MPPGKADIKVVDDGTGFCPIRPVVAPRADETARMLVQRRRHSERRIRVPVSNAAYDKNNVKRGEERRDLTDGENGTLDFTEIFIDRTVRPVGIGPCLVTQPDLVPRIGGVLQSVEVRLKRYLY